MPFPPTSRGSRTKTETSLSDRLATFDEVEELTRLQEPTSLLEVLDEARILQVGSGCVLVDGMPEPGSKPFREAKWGWVYSAECLRVLDEMDRMPPEIGVGPAVANALEQLQLLSAADFVPCLPLWGTDGVIGAKLDGALLGCAIREGMLDETELDSEAKSILIAVSDVRYRTLSADGNRWIYYSTKPTGRANPAGVERLSYLCPRCGQWLSRRGDLHLPCTVLTLPCGEYEIGDASCQDQ